MERKNWKFDIEINTNSEITLEKYCKQKILQHLLQQKPSLISSENYCKEKYESSKILRFDRLWKQWRCKIWPQNGRYQWYFICYRKLWYFYEIRDRVKILRFFLFDFCSQHIICCIFQVSRVLQNDRIIYISISEILKKSEFFWTTFPSNLLKILVPVD